MLLFENLTQSIIHDENADKTIDIRDLSSNHVFAYFLLLPQLEEKLNLTVDVFTEANEILESSSEQKNSVKTDETSQNLLKQLAARIKTIKPTLLFLPLPYYKRGWADDDFMDFILINFNDNTIVSYNRHISKYLPIIRDVMSVICTNTEFTTHTTPRSKLTSNLISNYDFANKYPSLNACYHAALLCQYFDENFTEMYEKYNKDQDPDHSAAELKRDILNTLQSRSISENFP